jgi:hypothetical protein
MTFWETLYSALVGALLVGSVIYTYNRFGTTQYYRNGCIVMAIGFLVVIGLSAARPQLVFSLSHSLRYLMLRLFGLHIYRHPINVGTGNYLIWVGVLSALGLLLYTLIGAYLAQSAWPISRRQVLLPVVPGLLMSVFVCTNRLVGAHFFAHVDLNTYSITFLHMLSACLIVLLLSLLYQLLGPIISVLSALVIADYGGAKLLFDIDFGIVFNAFSAIGLDNPLWQLATLGLSALWGVHDLLRDPLRLLRKLFLPH